MKMPDFTAIYFAVLDSIAIYTNEITAWDWNTIVRYC